MKRLDTVRLNQDLPDEGLHAGAVGVIVDVHTTSPHYAYEVEFVNDDGSTKALVALRQEQLNRA
jgi:diaminopimelate epimerase